MMKQWGKAFSQVVLQTDINAQLILTEKNGGGRGLFVDFFQFYSFVL